MRSLSVKNVASRFPTIHSGPAGRMPAPGPTLKKGLCAIKRHASSKLCLIPTNSLFLCMLQEKCRSLLTLTGACFSAYSPLSYIVADSHVRSLHTRELIKYGAYYWNWSPLAGWDLIEHQNMAEYSKSVYRQPFAFSTDLMWFEVQIFMNLFQLTNSHQSAI